MSDTTVPGPVNVWRYHCFRCGNLITGTGHTCPPGIYDQVAPRFPVGWPAPDYTAVLERIAAALERLADVSEDAEAGGQQKTAETPIESPARRCGTCKHWPDPKDPAKWRLCWYYPVEPACVVDQDRTSTTRDDGHGCPCWERRA